RRHMLALPLAVGCFAALHLAALLWIDVVDEEQIQRAIVNFLFFPPLLALFLGSSLGRAGMSAGNSYPLASFTATRPMSSTALVVAKLKLTALSTLAAWAIVILAASIWFIATGIYRHLPMWSSRLFQEYAAWKIGAGVLLVPAGLF